MMLVSIVVMILLWPLMVRGVPVNEEPPLPTEELLPYKESEDSQERLKNEVLHGIINFLDNKKVNSDWVLDCIAISPKLTSNLNQHYESDFFWYKSFTIEVFYMKGFMKISKTEGTKSVNIVHFCR